MKRAEYKTSLLAKEKDFNEKTNFIYYGKHDLYELNYFEGDGTGYITNKGIPEGICVSSASCTAPLLSHLQEWLMKEGAKVWCTPNEFSSNFNDFQYNIVIMDHGILRLEIKNAGNLGLSFDQALEKGILIALNRI